MWYQKTLTLSAKSRGFHLVTDEILISWLICRALTSAYCICCCNIPPPL